MHTGAKVKINTLGGLSTFTLLSFSGCYPFPIVHKVWLAISNLSFFPKDYNTKKNVLPVFLIELVIWNKKNGTTRLASCKVYVPYIYPFCEWRLETLKMFEFLYLMNKIWWKFLASSKKFRKYCIRDVSFILEVKPTYIGEAKQVKTELLSGRWTNAPSSTVIWVSRR